MKRHCITNACLSLVNTYRKFCKKNNSLLAPYPSFKISNLAVLTYVIISSKYHFLCRILKSEKAKCKASGEKFTAFKGLKALSNGIHWRSLTALLPAVYFHRTLPPEDGAGVIAMPPPSPKKPAASPTMPAASPTMPAASPILPAATTTTTKKL